MKRIWKCLLPAILGPSLVAMAAGKSTQLKPGVVNLEVLNPRGEIPPPPFVAPTARITDLAGKKIGLYWIGKAGGNNFWDAVEQLLKEKYPTAKISRYRGPFDLGEKRAVEIAKEVDTILYGVGD